MVIHIILVPLPCFTQVLPAQPLQLAAPCLGGLQIPEVVGDIL